MLFKSTQILRSNFNPSSSRGFGIYLYTTSFSLGSNKVCGFVVKKMPYPYDISSGFTIYTPSLPRVSFIIRSNCLGKTQVSGEKSNQSGCFLSILQIFLARKSLLASQYILGKWLILCQGLNLDINSPVQIRSTHMMSQSALSFVETTYPNSLATSFTTWYSQYFTLIMTYSY